MFTTPASDGTQVRAYDDGKGPLILLLGPGLDDGTRTKPIARILAPRYRVLRLHRRQYRLDLPGKGPWPLSYEVDDVVTAARAVMQAEKRAVGGRAVVYGHSDGAVVALEALVAEPTLFAGAVIFEPPAGVLGCPLGGADGALLDRIQALADSGQLRRSLELLLRDVVGLPPWEATLAAAASALIPRYRRLIASQVNAVAALDDLGERLDIYAQITQPTVLLGTDRSPAHLGERLDTLAAVLPGGRQIRLRHRDHGADLKHPRQVAGFIETLADEVLHATPDHATPDHATPDPPSWPCPKARTVFDP